MALRLSSFQAGKPTPSTAIGALALAVALYELLRGSALYSGFLGHAAWLVPDIFFSLLRLAGCQPLFAYHSDCARVLRFALQAQSCLTTLLSAALAGK